MSAEPSAQGRNLSNLAILGVMVVALFAALIWLTGLGGTLETPESAGSSLSSGRRGALALYRWLDRAGFEVSRAGSQGQFPPDADTMLMINPNSDFLDEQASSIVRWVESGRTLVLALGGRTGDLSTELGGRHPMLRELGIDMSLTPAYSPTVPLAQPLFNTPPLQRVHLPGVFSLDLPVEGVVVLASAAAEDGDRLPLVAMMHRGEGRVFLLSGDYPLTNEGLDIEDNGALIYNIVQSGGGNRVAFDEVHHGMGSGGDILALLTSNPWGWAILYGVGLLAAYTFWSARRIGPPLPVPAPDRRRPTSDYVRSVASLFRRARKPGYAAERYLRFFKRTLSRHAELDPFLTDARFVEALSTRGRHVFNPDEMLAAIVRLRQLEGGGASASEAAELETLKVIREAERLRRQALGLAQQD